MALKNQILHSGILQEFTQKVAFIEKSAKSGTYL